jgi:hypothetical protein
LVLALLVILSGTGAADDFDFDLLFGGEILQELEEGPEGGSPVEAVLIGEPIDLGGSYRLNVNGSRLYSQIAFPFPMDVTRDEFAVSLSGDLYMDLRPDPTWRAFVKGKYAANIGYESWPEGKSTEAADFSLHELFLDYTLLDKLYLRAGKQTINWGVGYFFSPADVINVGRIDPFDAEAPREGPTALKAHYPVGSNNYYLYLLFEDMDGLGDIAIAPKAEYVVGKTELGFGGYYRADRPLHLMATVSSTIGEVSVFGEGVVTVDREAGSEESPLSWQWTVGGRYSYRDEEGLYDITTAAQYLYSGTHQAAALLSWNNLLKSKLSAAGMWIGSLSDRSGILDFSLSLTSVKSIKPQVGIRRFYSQDQFSPLATATQVYAALTFGNGSF